jgi:hypothetical protein
MTSVTLWERSWRWVIVGAAVAALVSLPSVVRALPAPGAGVPPLVLASRMLASTAQPFAGYVETTGRLGLPNLGGAEEALGLVGETSRMRVWQAGPEAWRVDLLRVGGEVDTFGDERGIWTWDSNRRVAQRAEGSFQTRLPRPHDLLPPTLGLRLVQAAAPGELQPLRHLRVAGRSVPGIRIIPSSAISTIDHIDVWADPSTGVPVRVVVVAEGSSRPVFSSQFLEVSLAPVAAQRVRFEPPRTARLDFDDDGVDPLERWERSPFVLPDEIAGLARRTARPSAVATYGAGFTVVTVLAVPAFLVAERIPASVPRSDRPWGAAVSVISTPLVNVMAFASVGLGYIVSGAVTVAELDRVAAELVAVGAQP